MFWGLGTPPDVFLVIKTGHVQQEIRPSPAVFVATKTGILSQIKRFSEPKPSGFCAQTRSEQDATSRNVCVFGFADTYFANTYSGDCVVFQEVTAA